MASKSQKTAHYPNAWGGPAIVLGLGLILAALLAFAVLRPTSSVERELSSTAALAHMDAAEAQANEKRAAVELERRRLL